MTGLWIGFHVFVVAMVALDLGVLNREARAMTTRAAVGWTLAWLALSAGVGAVVWGVMGPARGVEFAAGYLVEYALSVDNLFVFLLLFAYFRVRAEYQHRLLFWGIVGEFAMRAPLIVLGTQVVSRFHVVLYAFGVFLLVTAGRMAFRSNEDEVDPSGTWMVRAARRLLPLSQQEAGPRFTVREGGRLKLTPLALVLVVLNATDLMFALDSIPAVLGVTKDPFVAYASNVCAIFGLRSLFFVVASLMGTFRFLKVGVAIILAFVGLKMVLSGWVEVPTGVSLGVIAALLVACIAASVVLPKRPTAS